MYGFASVSRPVIMQRSDKYTTALPTNDSYSLERRGREQGRGRPCIPNKLSIVVGDNGGRYEVGSSSDGTSRCPSIHRAKILANCCY